ncbi:MAG: hypothetical protein HZC55_23460 [Verrucomicrobia bacterium]|nr:hypothetical protein [Verrucomicrobiota bacterium]
MDTCVVKGDGGDGRQGGVRLLLVIVGTALAALGHGAVPPVPIVVGPGAPASVRSAALDLADGLGRLHPDSRFELQRERPSAGPAIVLGRSDDTEITSLLGATGPSAPEQFVVAVRREEGRTTGIIAGADPAGVVFGVYALLERLGHGFYLSYDAMAPAADRPFTFEGWLLADRPLARERIVFDWHNFLSGCSSWNFPEWARWIDQARKQRFNTVMVHAYGNNPMFTFEFGGQAKPVGFLTTTAKGRDWGTAHVNDVRRLAGGDLFSGPVFGADAALAPDARRVAETQGLMRKVFAHAAEQGMHVCFALDVDTLSSNPQNIITTLPETARFRLRDGTTWLARPDRPEGYAYYKAQAAALLALYPQIDRLALWVRTDRTTWTSLGEEDLPEDWRVELRQRPGADPSLKPLSQQAGRLGLGKVTSAFQQALRELGRPEVRVWMGSWKFAWMKEADPWTPTGVPFLPLDWDIVLDKSQFATPEGRGEVRTMAARRPVIPIAWAHHDDGQYIGCSYQPPERFHDLLVECGADSFGIIHWTTRPLDLYFKSLAEQVWQATSNRELRATCGDMAARTFGETARGAGGEFLFEWITRGPIFGRDTSDYFIDRPFPETRVQEALAAGQHRLALLDRIDGRRLGAAGRERWEYFRAMEGFYAAFHRAEGACQQAAEALRRGDGVEARRRLEEVDAAEVARAYARAVSCSGGTRGEQGVLVTLNLKWVSYVRALRQAVGLEPVRVKFGPTLHEELAQGAGRLSFFADRGGAMWRVLGARETKAIEWTLPEALPVKLPGGVPESWEEVARSGLATDQPLTLRVQPILNPKGGPELKVPAGRHRLTLLLVRGRVGEWSMGSFEVMVRAGGEGVGPTAKVEPLPGREPLAELEVRTFDLELPRPGVVEVRLQPLQGRAAVAGALLEAVSVGR